MGEDFVNDPPVAVALSRAVSAAPRLPSAKNHPQLPQHHEQQRQGEQSFVWRRHQHAIGFDVSQASPMMRGKQQRLLHMAHETLRGGSSSSSSPAGMDTSREYNRNRSGDIVDVGRSATGGSRGSGQGRLTGSNSIRTTMLAMLPGGVSSSSSMTPHGSRSHLNDATSKVLPYHCESCRSDGVHESVPTDSHPTVSYTYSVGSMSTSGYCSVCATSVATSETHRIQPKQVNGGDHTVPEIFLSKSDTARKLGLTGLVPVMETVPDLEGRVDCDENENVTKKSSASPAIFESSERNENISSLVAGSRDECSSDICSDHMASANVTTSSCPRNKVGHSSVKPLPAGSGEERETKRFPKKGGGGGLFLCGIGDALSVFCNLDLAEEPTAVESSKRNPSKVKIHKSSTLQRMEMVADARATARDLMARTSSTSSEQPVARLLGEMDASSLELVRVERRVSEMKEKDRERRRATETRRRHDTHKTQHTDCDGDNDTWMLEAAASASALIAVTPSPITKTTASRMHDSSEAHKTEGVIPVLSSNTTPRSNRDIDMSPQVGNREVATVNLIQSPSSFTHPNDLQERGPHRSSSPHQKTDQAASPNLQVERSPTGTGSDKNRQQHVLLVRARESGKNGRNGRSPRLLLKKTGSKSRLRRKLFPSSGGGGCYNNGDKTSVTVDGEKPKSPHENEALSTSMEKSSKSVAPEKKEIVQGNRQQHNVPKQKHQLQRNDQAGLKTALTSSSFSSSSSNVAEAKILRVTEQSTDSGHGSLAKVKTTSTSLTMSSDAGDACVGARMENAGSASKSVAPGKKGEVQRKRSQQDVSTETHQPQRKIKNDQEASKTVLTSSLSSSSSKVADAKISRSALHTTDGGHGGLAKMERTSESLAISSGAGDACLWSKMDDAGNKGIPSLSLDAGVGRNEKQAAAARRGAASQSSTVYSPTSLLSSTWPPPSKDGCPQQGSSPGQNLHPPTFSGETIAGQRMRWENCGKNDLPSSGQVVDCRDDVNDGDKNGECTKEDVTKDKRNEKMALVPPVPISRFMRDDDEEDLSIMAGASTPSVEATNVREMNIQELGDTYARYRVSPEFVDIVKSIDTTLDPYFRSKRAVHVWSEPKASTVNIRGAHYMTNGVKIPSKPSMFAVLGVDSLLNPPKEKSILHCSHEPFSYLNRLRRACDRSGVSTPFLLVINMAVPWGNLLAYMYRRDGTNGGPFNEKRVDVASERAWKDFLCSPDESYRNDKLKFIPRVTAGPWMIKKMVGGNPAILGHKLPTTYNGSIAENYLEICFDVSGGSKVANSIANAVVGSADSVTVDLGFVIEGNTDLVDLPEQVLCMFRLHHVSMKKTMDTRRWKIEVEKREKERGDLRPLHFSRS